MVNPIKITMKKEYSWKQYIKDVKSFDIEGSLLGSEEDEEGRIVFIIDKDKSNIQQTEDGHSKAKSSIPSGDISSVVSSSESCKNISEEGFVLSKRIRHYGNPRNWIEAEDIQKFLKLVKQDVNKFKLLEADFQSGEIEFSLTGELIPIEILNDIIKLRAGEELIQDG
jgi:hypothetical protein